MGELHKKRDPGVKAYDPKKVGPQYALKQHQCPYCWYSHHAKNVLTKHINEQHWQEVRDGQLSE